MTDSVSKGSTTHHLGAVEGRELAVAYLSRREYSVEELKLRLQRRGVETYIADEVVRRLAGDDLVSDQRFTQMYVRTRVRRLFGPLKIWGELRSRGIADAVIGENMPAEETWVDSASQWVGKRSQGKLDYKERAKLYRSLINRGFSHEQANVALDRLNSRD